MGWRLRKSINLPLGFRINLSKSGIGYSWGFPGYRKTKLVNGGNRTTYSLPGTGISYVEQNGSHSGRTQSNNLILGETESYDNIPIAEIEKNDIILKEINRIITINWIANTLIIFGILSFYNLLFLICLLIAIIIKIIIATKMKVSLYYEFDEETKKMYHSLKESLIILSNNDKLWRISSSVSVYNTKYNAGAGNNVDRKNATITDKLPWFIKTNIDIYGIYMGTQKMFFTPDRIIIFKRYGKAFGCKYNDMHINVENTEFIESLRVYSDSEVVSTTWQYANVDGGRDLRFSNNRQIPVCRYGILKLSSPNGINTQILYSNRFLGQSIADHLTKFVSLFNKILSDTKMKELKKVEGEKVTTQSKLENKKCDKILISDADEKIPVKEKKSNPITENKNYKLPPISTLDEESNSMITYIDKIKKDKNVLIPIGMSKDKEIIESLNNMPNLLVGGTVMSGKTSYINSIIGSILLTKKPNEVKFIVYDSKRIEYSYFNGLPHLLCPVLTDIEKAKLTLKMLEIEMKCRYDIIGGRHAKNIDVYNEIADKENIGKNEEEKTVRFPYIIVIIDDYNSLNSNDEINDTIDNITGKGWNVGIYMILASNHPSARVIPTISKSNFPARLSFRVASIQSSQAIIGDSGAEKLSGYGVALYTSKLTEKITRIDVPYISELSMQKIIEHCIKEQPAQYSDLYLNLLNNSSIINQVQNEDYEYEEPLYNDIVEFVVSTGKASASLLQRRFKFGYSRAAKAIDLLEDRGIIGPMNGSKPREVLIKQNNDDESDGEL